MQRLHHCYYFHLIRNNIKAYTVKKKKNKRRASRIKSTFIRADLTVSYTDLEEEYSWLRGRKRTWTRNPPQ